MSSEPEDSQCTAIELAGSLQTIYRRILAHDVGDLAGFFYPSLKALEQLSPRTVCSGRDELASALTWYFTAPADFITAPQATRELYEKACRCIVWWLGQLPPAELRKALRSQGLLDAKFYLSRCPGAAGALDWQPALQTRPTAAVNRKRG